MFNTNDLIKITSRDAITKFTKDHFNPAVFNSDVILNLNQNGRYQYFKENKSDTYYISEDEYFITDRILPVNNKQLIDDFTYRLNKNGYRSQHFDNFNRSEQNILTAGCSVTFGVGLPQELLWNNMLVNYINKKESTKFNHYDISYPGHSIFLIIKNIFSFIKKYGAPDKLFVLFPDIHRSVYYSYKQKEFGACTISINHLNHDLDQEIKNAVIGYNEGTQLIQIVSYIHALEALCSALEIDLIWTTWNKQDANKFNKINFDCFVYTNIFWPKDKKDFLENVEKNRYWDIASDDSHPGSGWHKMFYNSIIKDYEIREQNHKLV
jgi:hypothetical protein